MASTPVAIVVTKLSPADHDYPQLLARTLGSFGWNVVLFPAENIRPSPAFRDGFRKLIQGSGACAVWSVNFSGIVAELSLELGFVYVAWNEVYPLSFDMRPLPAGASVFCFESSRSMAEWWRSKNVAASFFPLGFDPLVFRPRSGGERDLALSFVGNGLAHMERSLDSLAREVEEAAAAAEVSERRDAFDSVGRFLASARALSFAELEAAGCDLERLIDEHCGWSLRSARGAPSALPPARSARSPLAAEVRAAVRETLRGMAPTVKGFLSRRQRIDTLARAAARAPLAIFGRDWEGTPVASCAAAPIAFDASGGIYARSRVSLHIQRFYAHNVNDRLFNVPAAGGFLLTRAAEGIEELYEPEREIAVYRSLEELESQLHRYLADDAARERVAEAGCRRAHAHYRIERRLWEALGRCGLPRPPSSPA